MTETNDGLVLRDRVYTVSEITGLVKLDLETSFPQVWVEGEISNLHRHTSGHIYFTLKDRTAALRAAMFRGEAARLRFEPKDGMQVVCRGRVSVYEPRGEYQLVVDTAEPKGKGALQLAFEQLKEKLRVEGLFDPGRKRKLPLLPKTVGVVTSPRGAAIVDIVRTLERRFAKLHVLIYPARVQGEGAADEIVAGIDRLGAWPRLDVLIVGRGGGSIEDLWAFNEESVARAIVRSPVPVISAVGHEVDFTIADFVADIRASTPTAAAEMVVEKEDAFVTRIANLERSAAQSVRFRVESLQREVTGLAQHRIFENFRVRLLQLGQRIDDFESRSWEVVRAEQRRIAEARATAALREEKIAGLFRAGLRDRLAAWEKLSAELQGRSPLAILKKGYALCWSGDGRTPVTNIEEVRAAEGLVVSFYRGEARCRVESVDREKSIESRAEKE
jgi:exodeoxyribonuclease VII large subunit